MPLGDGLCTMGYNTLDHDWSFYGMPEDLKGKTVLDIGANDGYYSFGAEARGASAVTAIDIYGGDGVNMVDGWPLEGISMLKEYLNSAADIRPMSVMDIGNLGQRWDVIFCNDVLSWLEDAPAAIRLMASCCKETLVLRDTFLTGGAGHTVSGHAQVKRLRLLDVLAQLKELGFRDIKVRQIPVFRHYIWQSEHFPGAYSVADVDVYRSPLDPVVTGKARPDGAWVLNRYQGFAYLKGLGWVKDSDVDIRPRIRENPVWSLIRKCLPDRILSLYYNRYNQEKDTGEFTITAQR